MLATKHPLCVISHIEVDKKVLSVCRYGDLFLMVCSALDRSEAANEDTHFLKQTTNSIVLDDIFIMENKKEEVGLFLLWGPSIGYICPLVEKPSFRLYLHKKYKLI